MEKERRGKVQNEWMKLFNIYDTKKKKKKKKKKSETRRLVKVMKRTTE